MLKKSSRPAVSNKQSCSISDPFSLPSSNNKTPSISSPLFPLSPKIFMGFSPKALDIDASMSPTSILETKPFTPTSKKPFFSKKSPRKPFVESTHEPKHNLGLADALEMPSSKQESKMILFGSQLKIQIPSLHSPIEFGVKNRESQLALLSSAVMRTSPSLVKPGCISASEMEMSEDYTCVIAHGPNPTTTHIYDNCIVESCGHGFVSLTPKRSESRMGDGFLASCDACKKELLQGEDIFMYRGEKAFCSRECRYQEMVFDEDMEDCWPSDPNYASAL